jgi:transcription-repair coupling factor (superfamily II helicase)
MLREHALIDLETVRIVKDHEGLERVVEYVKTLAPNARVGMAHGQLPEKRLEEAMHEFWHGEIDVLVCTAIVESGLDFPRANTLVVDQAQMFGLGQLYQLRGRVGRSDRQAYAYFMVNDVQNMPEMARERLRIILDMEYLGAGFQIAMEDLRLRGAGNILGESQSGQIAKVGLDLFLEMLEDEVRRLRGEPLYEEIEPELNIGFGANIPESYIADSRERLKYYKGFSSLRSADARADLEAEVRDRFGPIPEELAIFLDVLELKRTLARLQVAKADLRPQLLSLSFAEQAVAVTPEKLVAWIAPLSGWARLKPPATLELRPAGETIRERLQRANRELLALAPQPAEQTPAASA